jgi:hypothetical protein
MSLHPLKQSGRWFKYCQIDGYKYPAKRSRFMLSKGALQRQSLLFLFDISSTQIRPVLTTHFGKKEMLTILKETRQEMDNLIPQLPDTGGWRNPHTQFIVASAFFLAFYRTLMARGLSADEVGVLIDEAVRKMYSSRLFAILRLFSQIQRKFLGNWAARRLAAISQKRLYPGDFVCEFVEGDGERFDYGFDYQECGICKFFHAQNADEFSMYMCRLDYPYAEAMGTKLIRTSTIAEQGTKCDFRYKGQNAKMTRF